MAMIRKPYFVETVVNIENIKFRVCADENIYAVGKECISSTHNHSFYEIRYFTRGSGEIVIGDKHIQIEAGDLYLIHPNEYHYQNECELGDNVSQYSIRFSPIQPAQDSAVSQKRAYANLIEVLSVHHHTSDNELSLKPYFDKLLGEIKQREYGHVNCIASLLTVIMTDILRLAKMYDKKYQMAHTDDFSLETDAFFSREYTKKVTLTDFAKDLNISPRHASRIIRKNFGMSFVEKLTETRIEHAKVELSHSNSTLGEVASKCGFQSYGYFATCFKRYTGSTPTAYRKIHCKD